MRYFGGFSPFHCRSPGGFPAYEYMVLGPRLSLNTAVFIVGKTKAGSREVRDIGVIFLSYTFCTKSEPCGGWVGPGLKGWVVLKFWNEQTHHTHSASLGCGLSVDL